MHGVHKLMDTKTIQSLEALGCEVVRGRCVVIEDGWDLRGVDDDGEPRENRGKDGKLQDTFCTLPKGRAIKVYRGTKAGVKTKMASKTPDIVKEKSK